MRFAPCAWSEAISKSRRRVVRSAAWESVLETYWRDVRFRRLVRCSSLPVSLAVVVLTLALGVGANTAIFTLIDAVMLKALR